MESMTIFDINKICRVCLEEGDLISIYSSQAAISAMDMIISCTNVKITDNDELPSSICKKCTYRLGVAYQFKQQCENSDMRLRECLGLELINVHDIESSTLPILAASTNGNKMIDENLDITTIIDKTTIDVVKQEKQIISNIDADTVVHHQLVINNDNSTQVKDEEIYAAMKSVCEIFGNSETTDVSLVDDTTAELISITNNEQLLNGNYLNDNNVVGGLIVNDNENDGDIDVDDDDDDDDDDDNITTSLNQDILVHDHDILDDANHDLLEQNDIILAEENQILSVTDNDEPSTIVYDVVKDDLLNDDIQDVLTLANNNQQIVPLNLPSNMSQPSTASISTLINVPMSQIINANVPSSPPPPPPPLQPSMVKSTKLLPQSEAPPLVPIRRQSFKISPKHKTDERTVRNRIIDRKTKKKRSSKILKTKEDLDQFLEQRKSKRKAQSSATAAAAAAKSVVKIKNVGEKLTAATNGNGNKKKKELLKMPEQCFDCGKTFAYSGYLDAHIRTHTGERPYHCPVCKLKFAQSGNLALHLRVHTGERKYQCEICSKLFTTSSNLKAHQRIHSDSRNFKCSQCERAFKSASELLSHAGTHTGIKNHICKMCDKAFYKTSYLNVHFRTVHVGEKRHRCTECGKEFSNSSNLTCHFRIHTGEKPFSCKFCSAKFNQSSALIRHAKQHSSENGSKKSNRQQQSSYVATVDENNHIDEPEPTTTEPSLIIDQQRQIHEPLPTIITIPSSMIPDYKSTISDLTINSFSNYMKLPEQQLMATINDNSYNFSA